MIGKRIPRILLVDSEPKWTQAMEAALEEHGRYEVESVTDIDSALDRSYPDGFNLILVNSALALGGNETKLKRIIDYYPDKVLVVSDVRSISTAIEVFKMGADYTEKPFEPRRVVELVTSRLQLAVGTAD